MVIPFLEDEIQQHCQLVREYYIGFDDCVHGVYMIQWFLQLSSR